MATTFRDKNGTEVAHRFFGGATRGVQIELRPGASEVEIFTHLKGDDGSTTTLGILAQEIGNGKARDWVQRLARQAESHFDQGGRNENPEDDCPCDTCKPSPRSFGGALAAGVPIVIVKEDPNGAGLVDAVNRVADMLLQQVQQEDEKS